MKALKVILESVRIYLICTIILGLLYPLAITGLAQIFAPAKANGSLVIKDKVIVGSSLIGQQFTLPPYFQSRPSATDYNAANSGASNLGPTSKKMLQAAADRIAAIKTANAIFDNTQIPADMVLTSASGIDPHISIENAFLQVPRISQIRGIKEAELVKLVQESIDKDFLGLWGQSAVNVLRLNLALDQIKG